MGIQEKIENTILLIDFDGTIVESKFPNIGSFIGNSKNILQKLILEGFQVIINTCRSNIQEQDVKDFLSSNEISFLVVNENHPKVKDCFETDCRKLFGDITIDDTCMLFLDTEDGMDWDKIYDTIHRIINKPNFIPALSRLTKIASVN